MSDEALEACVYQTRFGEPDGNCWEACIATLLECDIDDVPVQPGEVDGMQAYLSLLTSWLQERYGCALLYVPAPETKSTWGGRFGPRIISGRTKNDVWHAIIEQDCEVIWDPHPNPLGDFYENFEVVSHWYLVPVSSGFFSRNEHTTTKET